MDPGVREGRVKPMGLRGRRLRHLLRAAVAAACLAAVAGCASLTGRIETPPEPVVGPAAPAVEPPPTDNAAGGETAAEDAPGHAGAPRPAEATSETAAGEQPGPSAGPALPERGAPGPAEAGAAAEKPSPAAPAEPEKPAETVAPEQPAAPRAAAPHEARRRPKAAPAQAKLPREAAGTPEPAWAKAGDDLVFRISYLGVTAGYARFTYKGRVDIEGRETYHIHVRAWTSSLLAVVYPLNDVLDYYLDVRTLEPIRQDFTQRERGRQSDTISIYDQEKGTITTRDRASGKFIKKVDVAPNIHDPVTAVYNFRARGHWGDGYVSRIYAGRKLWEIQANKAGVERIRMDGGGEFDTVLIRPVIRRDGKVEDKGDLRLWLSNDPRYRPLRIYAKIKLGTLVGELVPDEGGAGYAARQ